MRTAANRYWVIVLLVFLTTSFSQGQVYNITIMSSKTFFDLEFVSLEDSTLTMKERGSGLTLPIGSITSVQKIDLLDTSWWLTKNADHSLLRGALGGVLFGCGGTIIGAGSGFLLGSILAPGSEAIFSFTAGGIAVGATLFSIRGFRHFSDHKFGRNPNYCSLANLPLDEKYRRLEIIFLAKKQ